MLAVNVCIYLTLLTCGEKAFRAFPRSRLLVRHRGTGFGYNPRLWIIGLYINEERNPLAIAAAPSNNRQIDESHSST